jgi:hypothetical protein
MPHSTFTESYDTSSVDQTAGGGPDGTQSSAESLGETGDRSQPISQGEGVPNHHVLSMEECTPYQRFLLKRLSIFDQMCNMRLAGCSQQNREEELRTLSGKLRGFVADYPSMLSETLKTAYKKAADDFGPGYTGDPREDNNFWNFLTITLSLPLTVGDM